MANQGFRSRHPLSLSTIVHPQDKTSSFPLKKPVSAILAIGLTVIYITQYAHLKNMHNYLEIE